MMTFAATAPVGLASSGRCINESVVGTQMAYEKNKYTTCSSQQLTPLTTAQSSKASPDFEGICHVAVSKHTSLHNCCESCPTSPQTLDISIMEAEKSEQSISEDEGFEFVKEGALIVEDSDSIVKASEGQPDSTSSPPVPPADEEEESEEEEGSEGDDSDELPEDVNEEAGDNNEGGDEDGGGEEGEGDGSGSEGDDENSDEEASGEEEKEPVEGEESGEEEEPVEGEESGEEEEPVEGEESGEEEEQVEGEESGEEEEEGAPVVAQMSFEIPQAPVGRKRPHEGDDGDDGPSAPKH